MARRVGRTQRATAGALDDEAEVAKDRNVPSDLYERSEDPRRRVGVTWDDALTDCAGLWPEQLGLDACGECDIDDPFE